MAVKAASNVLDLFTKLQTGKQSKSSLVNDHLSQEVHALTQAHFQFMCYTIVRTKIDTHKFADPKVKEHLTTLLRCFALKYLLLDSAVLYDSGFFQRGQRGLLLDAMKTVVAQLRPQMLSLVELDTDEELDLSYLSAIGNKWGDIYERQLELAQNSRLNQKPIPDYRQRFLEKRQWDSPSAQPGPEGKSITHVKAAL